MLALDNFVGDISRLLGSDVEKKSALACFVLARIIKPAPTKLTSLAITRHANGIDTMLAKQSETMAETTMTLSAKGSRYVPKTELCVSGLVRAISPSIKSDKPHKMKILVPAMMSPLENNTAPIGDATIRNVQSAFGTVPSMASFGESTSYVTGFMTAAVDKFDSVRLVDILDE